MADEKGADGTNKDNKGNGEGTDPKQTENAGNQNGKDAKNGENAFDEKVFDDPRLWTHPRFKSLNERAKKADLLEKQQAEAEEKRLSEGKKFEELANKRAAERDEIKNKFTLQVQDNRILTEATKIGVIDVETVLKLVDRTNLHVDDNGNVTGAVEAVQALLAAKPFLKGKAGTVKIGSDSNPGEGEDANTKKFKLSQISNPEFYREHEKEILAAYKAGLIEDDMTK